jgi:pimeloyl-ACP methyl ester carboxylesterase
LADDMLGVVDHLVVAKVHFVGLSIGGVIDQRSRSAILIDTGSLVLSEMISETSSPLWLCWPA